MLERLYGNRLDVFENALSANSLRQRVTADNLANVNTPGFKRSEVSFRSALGGAQNALAMKTSDARHLSSNTNPAILGSLVKDKSSSIRVDGNNVDVETELTNLADAELRYSALTDFTSRYFRGLSSVINGQPR